MSKGGLLTTELSTGKEIFGQPTLWLDVYNTLQSKKEQIAAFSKDILSKNELRIILTGAGSSAFIGEAAQGVVQQQTKKVTSAIANTDIVTHPELFFLKNVPTLLISFARSGNSPESLEAIKLAEQHCTDVSHLIITCNKDGELANYTTSNATSCFKLILPEASNDKGLAMTGSFTSMLIAILSFWQLDSNTNLLGSFNSIKAQAEAILNQANSINLLASKKFNRVVFLGSGPALSIARECHLKLQELTNGEIVCKHDSFLGFRHGPRVVADKDSLIVYLFSNDKHAAKYEQDLVKSIELEDRNIPTLSVSGLTKNNAANTVTVHTNATDTNHLNIVPLTLIGQLLGYYKSLELGLNPDNPSINGTINRVVQGVTIYKKEVE
jgi:tagatose-6-phosphate ketose/aldose isomerase